MEKKTAAKKMSECTDIVQSYGSTIMCYNYTTYQQRIMTKIAEFCQVAMRGENYAEHLNTPFCTDGVNINMAVAVSDIIWKSHNKETLKAWRARLRAISRCGSRLIRIIAGISASPARKP